MLRFSRRVFVLGSLTGVAAAACGGGGSTPAESGATTTLAGAGIPSFLQPTFPDGYRQAATVVAGIEQRLGFVLGDPFGPLRADAPERLEFALSAAGSPLQRFTVTKRSDGIVTPYYAARLTFGAPGAYSVALPDFPDIAPAEFLVVTAAEVAIPQVGDPLPVLATPTVTDPLGVTPICTRAQQCPFHDHSLDEVATNGRPTVLLVATPGFCQTDICGPVVELLIDGAAGRDDLDVIHAEVYVDPSDFQSGGFPDLTPVVERLALPFEPALFVADGSGRVVARLDTTFDRSELADVLAKV